MLNRYLQYKNTPKPRVLVEGVDYNIKTGTQLLKDTSTQYEWDFEEVADLSDCRGLLSVEIEGKVWTEGDIICKSTIKTQVYGIFYYNKEGANFMFDFGKYALSIFDLNVEYFRHFGQFSFFDNPAKYSKLLWNCNEQEGWGKVLKLLGIK
jgi:hypothetical protein